MANPIPEYIPASRVMQDRHVDRVEAAGREPLISAGMRRLEHIVSDAESLGEYANSRLITILFNQPASCCEGGKATPYPGSDLGQTLMILCDRLDGHLRNIRETLDSVDL